MRTSKFTKALTFALPPEHFEQIQKITDEQEISLAQWVREAVEVALKNNKRKEDTM